MTTAQQTDWLLRQAARHGFIVPTGAFDEPDVAVHGRRTMRFDRRGRTVTLATAVFEGILRVDEPEALRAALVNGIGPAKGYGCGLLTLAVP